MHSNSLFDAWISVLNPRGDAHSFLWFQSFQFRLSTEAPENADKSNLHIGCLLQPVCNTISQAEDKRAYKLIAAKPGCNKGLDARLPSSKLILHRRSPPPTSHPPPPKPLNPTVSASYSSSPQTSTSSHLSPSQSAASQASPHSPTKSS